MKKLNVKLGLQLAAGVLAGVFGLSSCDSGALVVDSVEQQTVNTLDRFSIRMVPGNSASTKNLLSNAFFEEPLGNLPGWSACESQQALQLKTNLRTRTQYVEVGAGDCILQAVTVKPGKKYTLSCDVLATSTDGWSGLGMSFYNADGEFISEPAAAQPPGNVFQLASRRKIVHGKAPADASIGLAWFYTDTGGTIDNCVLQRRKNTTTRYRKTVSLEKFRGGRTTLGGTEGVSFNGHDELQSYGHYAPLANVIDGFDIPDARYRKVTLAMALTAEYLYINVSTNKANDIFGRPLAPGFIVFDDSYPVNGELWNDDSFEIYLNPGNEVTSGYDDNDFVRIFGLSAVSRYEPTAVTGINSKLNLPHEAICSWVGIRGGTGCDVRFRLEDLGLAGADIAEIGFDVHANVDDDGGDRDAKYSWCSGTTLDAWKDMSKVNCSITLIQQPDFSVN